MVGFYMGVRQGLLTPEIILGTGVGDCVFDQNVGGVGVFVRVQLFPELSYLVFLELFEAFEP